MRTYNQVLVKFEIYYITKYSIRVNFFLINVIITDLKIIHVYVFMITFFLFNFIGYSYFHKFDN